MPSVLDSKVFPAVPCYFLNSVSMKVWPHCAPIQGRVFHSGQRGWVLHLLCEKHGTGFVRGPAEASTCIVTWTSEPDSWGAALNLPHVGWLIQTSSKVGVWKDYDRGAALWGDRVVINNTHKKSQWVEG